MDGSIKELYWIPLDTGQIKLNIKDAVDASNNINNINHTSNDNFNLGIFYKNHVHQNGYGNLKS